MGLTWNNILRSAVNNNVNILGEASYSLEPKTVQQLLNMQFNCAFW